MSIARFEESSYMEKRAGNTAEEILRNQFPLCLDENFLRALFDAPMWITTF
jgi:hypothetical protein